MKNYEFWFVVGSQFLYGPEVLETVESRAKEMAEELSKVLPYPLVYKVWRDPMHEKDDAGGDRRTVIKQAGLSHDAIEPPFREAFDKRKKVEKCIISVLI